jgi:four helix bundle protein
MSADDLTFEAWRDTIPAGIRAERFWSLIAYQKGLYLYDLLWQDAQLWLKDARGWLLARQVIGSADSVCSNIEEGFGRGFGRQLVQFYVYSLGSARETKGHLYRARAFYSADALNRRLALAGEVVALLITEVNRQKSRLRP